MRIHIYMDADCLYIDDEAYQDAFEDAVTERLEADYPEAKIEIERCLGPTRVYVSDSPQRDDRDVERDVDWIMDYVRRKNDFWPPP